MKNQKSLFRTFSVKNSCDGKGCFIKNRRLPYMRLRGMKRLAKKQNV